MTVGIRLQFRIGIVAAVICVVLFFVVPLDWIIVPFLLFFPIAAYLNLFLRCPNCKMAVLCHRTKLFGTELWVYGPWLKKHCDRCLHEFD